MWSMLINPSNYFEIIGCSSNVVNILLALLKWDTWVTQSMNIGCHWIPIVHEILYDPCEELWENWSPINFPTKNECCCTK
jgi:hypothetical protein